MVSPNLQAIVERAAGLLNPGAGTPSRREVARRCRGTRVIANPCCAGARCGQRCAPTPHRAALVAEALSLHRVDDRGLDASDRALLEPAGSRAMARAGGPRHLAAGLGEDRSPGNGVEPYLLHWAFCCAPPVVGVATPRPARQQSRWPEAA